MRAALDTRCPQGFGRREGNFPAWIPKTDEERLQNLADWPEKLKGILWEVTEKKDGSSMTVFWSPANRADNTFGYAVQYAISAGLQVERTPPTTPSA